MARPAPSTAAGPAASTAARASNAATCRSDPPLARSMVSSTSRRATIILAASRITAAPTTIRLTNSSSSTVSMAAWVPRNSDRSEISGEVTVSVSALGASGPVSAGGVVIARLSALSRPCAWSAVTLLGSSGNSQLSSMPGPLNASCIAASWSGSAKTPPTQNGMVAAVSCWSAGVPAVESCVQKVEPGARSRTIAVTKSPTGPAGVATDRRLPGCNPNRAAVCVVAATATIPAGTAPPAYAPAVSWALLVSGSR